MRRFLAWRRGPRWHSLAEPRNMPSFAAPRRHVAPPILKPAAGFLLPSLVSRLIILLTLSSPEAHMFVDRLSEAQHYAEYHPGFRPAFAFLTNARVRHLELGRHTLDGERLFVLIVEAEGRGREQATLEAHRKYIDIQLSLAGMEEIGWRPTADCREPLAEYDSGNDVQFFADRPEVWVPMPAKTFAVFFPQDAHAPFAGSGVVHKAVVKVAVDW